MPRDIFSYPFSMEEAVRLGNHAPRYLDPEWVDKRIDFVCCRDGAYAACLRRAHVRIAEIALGIREDLAQIEASVRKGD